MSGISKVKVPKVVLPGVLLASENMDPFSRCPDACAVMPVVSLNSGNEALFSFIRSDLVLFAF